MIAENKIVKGSFVALTNACTMNNFTFISLMFNVLLLVPIVIIVMVSYLNNPQINNKRYKCGQFVLVKKLLFDRYYYMTQHWFLLFYLLSLVNFVVITC